MKKHKYEPSILSNKDLIIKYHYFSNITEISYYKLKVMLESNESFILFIGGYWCPNCLAIMKALSETLVEKNKTIYLFNPRLGYNNKAKCDIRKAIDKDSETKLKFISSHMELDIPMNINNTYSFSVPFITKFENGKAVNYYSEEYPLIHSDEDEKKIKEEIFRFI